MEYTRNEDYALDDFSAPVQCGECYVWYDAEKHAVCPVCSSEEVVGDR